MKESNAKPGKTNFFKPTILPTTLSILIPAYNEEKLIPVILQKVKDVRLNYDIKKEIIVIDDCSTDKTGEAVHEFIKNNPGMAVSYVKNTRNSGKGASVRTGIKQAGGDIVIIQDADLEYDPDEYNKLLKPIMDNHADVVYGSRFRGSDAHRVLFFSHSFGNKLLTFFSNVFTGLNLSDMETGYKMFKKDMLEKIRLKENRFGIEPEITAKISRVKGIRIYEVGISYYGRTYAEGKKIGLKDGIKAFWCIFKYNTFSRK